MYRLAYTVKAVSRAQPKFQPKSMPTLSYKFRSFSTTEEPKVDAQNDSSNGEQKVEDSANAAAKETEALKAEIKDLKERVLRSLAEEENVRRIAKRDVENAHAYANVSFAKSMLDVADDLERALNVVPVDQRKSGDKTLQTLVEGIEMTDKNLHKIFKKFGIVKFGKVDEPFDPHHHDALYRIPDAEKPDTIGQVVKAGYKLKDRVIRAAEVGARVAP